MIIWTVLLLCIICDILQRRRFNDEYLIYLLAGMIELLFLDFIALTFLGLFNNKEIMAMIKVGQIYLSKKTYQWLLLLYHLKSICI